MDSDLGPRHVRHLRLQPRVLEHLGAHLGLPLLQMHDALLDTRQRLDPVLSHVDEATHNHLLRLTSTVGAADRLKLRRWIPRWASDVNSRRLLQVETHPTRLDLDHKHRVGWPLLEFLDTLVALLFRYRAVYPEDGRPRLGQKLLDTVHLTHELSENEGLFSWMGLDALNKRLHLARSAEPRLWIALLLEGDPIQVQLGPRHHLTDTQETLEQLHLMEILCTGGKHVAYDRLALVEHVLVKVALLWVHLQLQVLEVAWWQLETLVELGDIRLGASQHKLGTNLVRVALDHLARQTHKRAQGHKVLDGVKDGRTGHDPADGCGESPACDMTLTLLVANLVALIEDHAVPPNTQKLTDGSTRALRQNRVRRHHNRGELLRQFAPRPVKCVGTQARGESGHLRAPLAHDRLGHNHERVRLGVGQHSCDELDRLPEAHLITEKATRARRVQFALHEPSNTLVLVRRNEARFEHCRAF